MTYWDYIDGETIKESDYTPLSARLFAMRFFNPSPGNPDIKTFFFNNSKLYVIWMNDAKTVTKIDKFEKEFEDGEEIGVTLWMDGKSIFLSISDFDEDDEEDEDDEADEDDEDNDESYLDEDQEDEDLDNYDF